MPVDVNTNSKRLRDQLDQIPSLSGLAAAKKNELSQWILANGPYGSLAELRQRLSKTGIKGFTRAHQESIAKHFSAGLGRRRFLAATAVGAASLASLGAGAWLWLQPADDPELVRRPAPDSLLAERTGAEQKSVGQAIQAIVDRRGIEVARSSSEKANWASFLHALDMSNWIEAATFLYESTLWRRLLAAGTDEAVTALAKNLQVLNAAWNYLLDDTAEWKDEFFVGYAFGKMPALAAPAKGAHRYPGGDATAREFMADINRLAFTFMLLEIQNQRFQRPGKTTSGAPIRFSQGHNYSYAHAGAALVDAELFPPDRQTILVNWDAHADLGDPFANPRMDLHSPFERLQKAATIDDRVRTASVMSIAGWILALVYERFFSHGDEPAELVWIVPKEAHLTSTCMEPYGTYTITVGDWKLPEVEEMRRISATPVGEWNVPGEKEVRSYSDRVMLRSVTTPQVLQNQKTCVVHIIDADDPAAIEKVIGDRQIFLSADVDYAGTQEPGLRPRRGYLPHYPLNGTPEEQARHEQLIGRFGDFYGRFHDQIRSVSIANSPDFTVDEETRKPVAKLLNIVTGGDFAGQPEWLAAEWNRVAVPVVERAPLILKTALAAGGAAGLLALVGALEIHRKRVQRVRSVLPLTSR